MNIKNNLIILFILTSNSVTSNAFQSPPASYPFPIEHYSQAITDWIKPSPQLNKPLLTVRVQHQQFKNFKEHYIGSQSPWNDQYIATIQSSDLKIAEQTMLEKYDKNYICEDPSPNNPLLTCVKIPKKTELQGRGICDATNPNANQIYPDDWINQLKTQVNLSQFTSKNTAQGKAIAIQNLNARALPTDDHYFHDCNSPGEGDSFDYLQTSALWAGTPVYILGESADHRWYLVLTPDFIAWVKSTGIAKVSHPFIAEWRSKANQSLVAITSPMNNPHVLSIVDEETHQKRFTGYIGMVFPLEQKDKDGFHILIPVMDNSTHQASIKKAYLSKKDATLIPLMTTTNNLIKIINNLKGRTYGWGNLNVENPTEFYNDCSAELKSLYTPFGIWLPRHSTDQVDTNIMLGYATDLTSLTLEERIHSLSRANAHRFMTVVYIGGHVFMYLGNYSNPGDASHEKVVLTYQDMWGLRPMGEGPDGRYVIGKSVFFPLLAHYPEKYPGNRELISLADKKYFIMAYLDQISSKPVQLLEKLLNLHEIYRLMTV
ncbi:MAG: peptidase family [Gammaproteobacteria bacterium]|nr:peptidase family [Gammaproteobacteria bacterium]